MVEEQVEEVMDNTSSIDIQEELSMLVSSNVIPQQIADILGKKLIEKNISLSKDQLYAIADKIKDLVHNYKQESDKFQQQKVNTNTVEKNNLFSDEFSQNLNELFNRLDGLQNQIDTLQEKNKSEDNDINFTEDKELSNGFEKVEKSQDIHNNFENDESFNTNLLNDPLSGLPNDPESIIVLMNWLQYLIDRCGYTNLKNILEYYVDIDWITDDVRMSLLDYSTGIKQEKDEKNKPYTSSKIHHLPSKNHIQSYMFIQKLKGKKFDKHFVEKIQGELSRQMKKIDKYQQFR